MGKKVTLLELVATKIIYALLIAVYYWMCARRNWHDYYETIQYVVAAFTIIFLLGQSARVRKFNQEKVDELARQNLDRANTICMKIGVVFVILIAFIGALELINGIMMGYLLVGSLLILAIIRTIVFYIMDKKGI